MTLLEERIGQTARRKRPTRAQIRLAREFDRDVATYERSFRVQVLKVLSDMGREIDEIAVDVLAEAEPEKDAGDDALAAAVITERLDIEGFEADLSVVYTNNYRRILKATEKRINGVMDLGVTIPNPLEAEILSAGGKRVGLLDMTRQTKRRVFQQLSEGRFRGESVPQLAKRLRDFVPAGRFRSAKTRATLIARTETTHAQQIAASETYRRGGVTEVLIMDSRKGSFDAECDMLDGRVVSLAEGEALMADEHPNGTRRMVAMPPEISEDIG